MIDILAALGESGQGFDSAFVLTYRLDLELYDGLIRRVLNKAGIANQVVFCDFQPYVDELRVQRPRYIGRQYSVVPVHQGGAFHPKVYLLLGPNGGRALVGSGNTTLGGIIRNAEVFGRFDYRHGVDVAPHPIFGQLAEWIRQLSRASPTGVAKQVEQGVLRAGWLSVPPVGDGRRLLIGGPGRTPLIAQISECLPSDGAAGLTVCSSSFDRQLAGLRRLAALSSEPPICIVQSEKIDIDGLSVQAVGDAVEWRQFHDPLPREKRRRRDVFAHAKLFVFSHGDSETTVFGSCNASEPALSGVNTETVVVLPNRVAGQTASQLGLDESLRGDSAREQLTAKTWPKQENWETQDVVLLGIWASDDRYQLTLKRPDLPPQVTLALSSEISRRPTTTLALVREGALWQSEPTALTEIPTFGWLMMGGERISNPVAITWPEVAYGRRNHSLGRAASAAILSIQDGVVLGTVLFDLLDSFRDFEVRAAGRRVDPGRAEQEPEGEATQKPASFFYTDADPILVVEHHWSGDRLDLDILASLVQPLSHAPVSIEEEADDEFDERALQEEAERRQIDANKGRATGAERQTDEGVTDEKVQSAIRRLERRLAKSAEAIERSLVGLDKIQSVPPASIARQLWMVQIGAFLAGRQVRSKSGTPFVALSPSAFARYVLRVARALVGSRRGGFLDRLPLELWNTSDGEMVRRGLAFLQTCVAWSAARVMDDNASIGDESEWPKHLACAVPDFVAARFMAMMNRLQVPTDDQDLDRRFPECQGISVSAAAKQEGITRLTQLIEDLEGVNAPALTGELRWLGPGTLAFNEKLGVTVLTDCESASKFWAVDLSKDGNYTVKYSGHMKAVPSDYSPRLRCWAKNIIQLRSKA